MGYSKKHAKGRLDKWYKLAKEKGYRARAAFKLIQLNKKYHVLEKSKVVLDLCAAPGSWCQVAAEAMPANSLIVGVDLAPIKPIPRVITFQSDITTDKCRAQIRQHLKNWKVDTVLHDGAPNVGTAWIQDAFTQAELVLQSFRLATEFLAPGGTFITKIFRSKDYNSLLFVFNNLFGKVEATKPPSSRNVSAEVFVICREYKAPKHIDPRFLDPKSVFAELAAPTPNNEAKVFNPEKKKRKREGYEEGDWTQYKEAPASDFIQTTDPIAMLGTLNSLSFKQPSNGDVALAALDKMPETSQETRDCCADLKVLGRKEFKLLLKWRLKVRELFKLTSKEQTKDAQPGEEVAEVEPMDEEMQIQEELQRLKEQVDSKKKKERRKENEQKQKEIVRMQLNMTTPHDILDESNQGDDSMFALKSVDRSGIGSKFATGRMHTTASKPEPEHESSDGDDESDDEQDDLEGQLDQMYGQYQEQRAQADSKYRAKQAKKEHKDEDFEGFSDREEKEDSSDSDDLMEDDASEISENGEDAQAKPLFHGRDSDAQKSGGLSNRASMFFEQDLFKNIPGLNTSTQDDSGIDMQDSDESYPSVKAVQATTSNGDAHAGKTASKALQEEGEEDSQSDSGSSDPGFEVVKSSYNEDDPEDWTEGTTTSKPTQTRPNVDIITAEAMTLAHQLATGTQTKQSLLDDNFNKYSFRDTDGLPDWFLDDESQHSRPQRPITKEAADAIKDKERALNARPIKKVREAKARKKMRAARRLEKMKKKSAVLAEDGEVSERDKAQSIEKMMKRAVKKQPRRETKVVVAKGANRGISGRPKGTKGRYKMVDPRLKKDMRGLKRASAKKKK
ncbi:MAG: AdoMet-dependent rRNA methyltransferase spb1 [Alyxoria varia]|nr:MAG: AdoMet-dependent rRNA methyltransferase spb1 [Alyxoria varia]